MKKIILTLYIFFCVLIRAQSLTSTENYVYNRIYTEAVTSEQANATQIQTVQYLDGLGRPAQSVGIKASPSGKDIVIPITYDSSGRQTKSFLPMPSDSQNGAYFPGVNGSSVNTYYGVANAYSETAYEKSPLERPEKLAMPGSDWQIAGSHTKKTEYGLNGEGKVKRFKAVTVWNQSAGINDVSLMTVADDAYTLGGYYRAATLFMTVSTDEDGNETHTFTNSRGQKIMFRQINRKANGISENLDTYYVYNESGNTVFVIPPKASVLPISQNILDNLCYQYKYDQYNRLVEKKLPGRGWEFTVYDKQNRPVLSQDGLLSGTSNGFAKKGWMFKKYDIFSRPVYSGFFANSASRKDMQTILNNMATNTLNNEETSTTSFAQNGINVYYTKNAFPTENMTVLGVNYYGEYPTGFPERPAQIQGNNTLSSVPTTIVVNGLSSIRSIKTFPTASLTRNIENENWTSSALWYDTLGRIIGTYQGNHLGGFTRTESILDFSGKIKELYTFHSKNTASVQATVKDRFLYNPQGFLLKHYQQINTNPEEELSEYIYNDLGQVTSKKTGNGLQNIDYTYNIRGWLTGINPSEINSMGNKLFAYRIKYNTIEGVEMPNNSFPELKVKPKYNGSIAEVDWKTAFGANEPLRRYGYVYDGVMRLLAGFYQISTNPYSKEYSEVIDYDQNGNITTLQRTGSAVNGKAEVIDNLTYSYLNRGNQLEYVQESGKGNALSGYPLATGQGSTIQYDSNGNITQHLDKRHEKIAYNFLNLPSTIFSSYQPETLKYIYSSDGTKVQMTKDIEITDYLGAFQYTVNNSSGLQTSFVLANEEGYYDFVNSRYVYQYKDHLGNIRVSYAKGNGGQPIILEENNYYPFGLKHSGYNTGTTANNKFKYLYNGKELQSTGNLDYGWRQYMPDLARWNGMDQLAESYNSTSPYTYVMNNPISYLDPDGRDIEETEDSWNFTGDDISWAMSYIGNGGKVKNLDTALASWLVGGNSFGSNNESFWQGFEGLSISLPEVIIKAKGNSKTWNLGSNLDFNSFLMYSKFTGALGEATYDLNSSRMGSAILNSKASQSVAGVENFLFLELPATMLGGEVLALGWRAAGMSRIICRPLGRITNGLIKICFTEGTLISTDKGNKRIENIKEGDLVWSYNEETGKKELKKVVELSQNRSSSLVKISVDGTEIICTPEHPFYVNGNWIEAKKLSKGMLLTSLDKKTSSIESIKFLDEKVKVYNFEVEGNHNYYVSKKNILVHNDCGVSAIIEAMPSSLKQLNMCKSFAAELMERMTAQGLKGEMVTLKSQTRGIWSNTFNRTITDNGEHVGVKVGNMIYDNLFPKGIEYSKWLMDLEVGSWVLPPPTIVPF